MTLRRILKPIAFAWLLALTAYSLQSGRAVKRTSTLHDPAHVVAFGIPALMLCAGSGRRGQLAAAGAVIALGASIEFSQHLIYRIDFEWMDLIDDAVGAAAAWWGAQWTVIGALAERKIR